MDSQACFSTWLISNHRRSQGSHTFSCKNVLHPLLTNAVDWSDLPKNIEDNSISAYSYDPSHFPTTLTQYPSFNRCIYYVVGDLSSHNKESFKDLLSSIGFSRDNTSLDICSSAALKESWYTCNVAGGSCMSGRTLSVSPTCRVPHNLMTRSAARLTFWGERKNRCWMMIFWVFHRKPCLCKAGI